MVILKKKAWQNNDVNGPAQDMSIDLKKKGFKFAGPTICYAFMQAAGMVNDHIVDCFRYRDL